MAPVPAVLGASSNSVPPVTVMEPSLVKLSRNSMAAVLPSPMVMVPALSNVPKGSMGEGLATTGGDGAGVGEVLGLDVEFAAGAGGQDGAVVDDRAGAAEAVDVAGVGGLMVAPAPNVRVPLALRASRPPSLPRVTVTLSRGAGGVGEEHLGVGAVDGDAAGPVPPVPSVVRPSVITAVPLPPTSEVALPGHAVERAGAEGEVAADGRDGGVDQRAVVGDAGEGAVRAMAMVWPSALSTPSMVTVPPAVCVVEKAEAAVSRSSSPALAMVMEPSLVKLSRNSMAAVEPSPMVMVPALSNVPKGSMARVCRRWR